MNGLRNTRHSVSHLLNPKETFVGHHRAIETISLLITAQFNAGFTPSSEIFQKKTTTITHK